MKKKKSKIGRRNIISNIEGYHVRVAVSSNTMLRIGGQYLTRTQLTREFKKYEEVGILEQIAEAYLIMVKDRMLNVQLIPTMDTIFQPKNIVEAVI